MVMIMVKVMIKVKAMVKTNNDNGDGDDVLGVPLPKPPVTDPNRQTEGSLTDYLIVIMHIACASVIDIVQSEYSLYGRNNV
jgi:hypothetical protein